MPRNQDKSLNLEDFLPYRLSILSNTVSRAIAVSYAERFNLSIPEWRIMAVLGRFPGLSARQVAERTAMDKVAVSRAVSRLIDAGRVQRRVADADRRRSILELSPRGENVYREVTPMAKLYEDHLLEDLSDSERQNLDKALARLMNKAKELDALNLE